MEKDVFHITIDSLMRLGLDKPTAYKALRDIRRMVRRSIKK